ncbi:MAG: phosphoribosylanthranilate isomerase [Chloroflexi bacterium]|nr:phosphoribosylanthranilate isomerase [Chloroflexota bacterium]
MIIQIYAFTNLKEAVAAVEMGVDNIGFIAGKYGEVYAELSFEEAREIVRAIPAQGTSTAITMAVDVDEILRMAEQVEPDIVHISSEVEQVNMEAMRTIHEKLSPDILLMKAISVENAASVEVAIQYAEVSDLLLLDTSAKGFPGVGATGFTHDWNVSKRIVEEVEIPVILAGGLSAANVQEAMEVVRPWGVDSNTSTNIEGSRVLKDLKRIEEFVKAVKSSPFYEPGRGLRK